MSDGELVDKAVNFAQKYSKDIIGEDLVQEMKHITIIHKVTFGTKHLGLVQQQ